MVPDMREKFTALPLAESNYDLEPSGTLASSRGGLAIPAGKVTGALQTGGKIIIVDVNDAMEEYDASFTQVMKDNPFLFYYLVPPSSLQVERMPAGYPGQVKVSYHLTWDPPALPTGLKPQDCLMGYRIVVRTTGENPGKVALLENRVSPDTNECTVKLDPDCEIIGMVSEEKYVRDDEKSIALSHTGRLALSPLQMAARKEEDTGYTGLLSDGPPADGKKYQHFHDNMASIDWNNRRIELISLKYSVNYATGSTQESWVTNEGFNYRDDGSFKVSPPTHTGMTISGQVEKKGKRIVIDLAWTERDYSEIQKGMESVIPYMGSNPSPSPVKDYSRCRMLAGRKRIILDYPCTYDGSRSK